MLLSGRMAGGLGQSLSLSPYKVWYKDHYLLSQIIADL